jgi:excisionase family DNA binding protein
MNRAILEIAEELARLSIQFNALQNRLAAIAADPPEKLQKPLVNAERIGELLGCDVQAVYRLAKERAIPFVKVGARTIKFDENIVVEWIRSGGTKPSQLVTPPGKEAAESPHRSHRSSSANGQHY